MQLRSLAVLLPLVATTLDAETVKTPVWLDARAGEFAVSLDGESVPVESLQTSDDYLVLLLVMDTVKRPDRTSVARDAIVGKLKDLGPKYFAGLMSAQDGLEVQLDPIRGRQKLRDKLNSLDVRGVPALLDVVGQVSGIADKTLTSADVRVAVLFVTDGEIEDYRGGYTIPVVNPSDQRDLSRRFRSQLILERIRSIADRLESAQAPLFFLHLARKYDELNEVYQNGINEFAQMTGGRALFARGVQEVPAMVDQILDEIAAHSVVTLEVGCGGIKRMEVQPAEAVSRHRETIRCPVPGS